MRAEQSVLPPRRNQFAGSTAFLAPAGVSTLLSKPGGVIMTSQLPGIRGMSVEEGGAAKEILENSWSTCDREDALNEIATQAEHWTNLTVSLSHSPLAAVAAGSRDIWAARRRARRRADGGWKQSNSAHAAQAAPAAPRGWKPAGSAGVSIRLRMKRC
jgi:hypothetical protein